MNATSTFKKSFETITFASEFERILFFVEMRGQLSDGHWENATPHNHWMTPCSVSIDATSIDPNKPGRNFYGKNYYFANKDLIEVVGDRMGFYLGMYLVAPGQFLRWMDDNDGNFPIDEPITDRKENNYYWTTYGAKLEAAGLGMEVQAKAMEIGKILLAQRFVYRVLVGLTASWKGEVHKLPALPAEAGDIVDNLRIDSASASPEGKASSENEALRLYIAELETKLSEMTTNYHTARRDLSKLQAAVKNLTDLVK